MFGNFQEKVIEALAIVNSNLWYVAWFSDRSIGKWMIKENSVGLQFSLDSVISYNRAWQNVYCIGNLKESLVLDTTKNISRVTLDTNQIIDHIGVDFKPM